MSEDNTKADDMADHTTTTTTDAAGTPRTRWAAILWGLVLAAVAAAALWLVLSPGGPAGFADWLVGLTPLSVVAYAVVAVGALLLVGGIAGLARRGQVHASRRHGAASPSGR